MLSLLLLQALALEGGTVHTMVPGEPPSSATVLIEEGKIVAVGAEVVVPDDAERVDATGLHILPSLIDGMVHHDLQHDPLYLLAGIGLARDMGNEPGRIFLAAEPGVRNTMPGPELFICGPIFDGDPPATTEAAVARTPEEVDAHFDRLLENGIQFTTFHLGLPRPAWEHLIERSHENELQVWGPLPRGVSLREALAAGQDGVCYLEGFRGEDGALLTGQALEEEVAAFAASGAALTPLLRVYGYRTEDPGEDPSELAYLAPYYAKWWMNDLEERRKALAEPGYLESGLERYAALEALFLRLYEAGVPLVPGSGAPNPWLLPGEALHDELAAFVQAGVPPYEALRCATSGAARALGLDEQRGTIRPGLTADLVLSVSDPREGLEDLRRPASLVVRGVYLDGPYLTDLRDAVVEQQAEARLQASEPLVVERPELPEGTVVLQGRVEAQAFDEVTAAEEYWVVRGYDGATSWVARMVTPPGLGVAPTAQTLVQRFVDGRLVDFELDVRAAGAHYRVEGLVVGKQFRVKRWMNEVALDTNSTPRRPHLVDAGLSSAAMLLAHYRGTGRSQVLYFKETEPSVATWETQLTDGGLYAVRTPTGPLVFTVSENGAFDKLARTEGKGAARYGAVSADSFGGPGMPPRPVEPAEEEAPEPETEGDSGDSVPTPEEP